MKIVLRTLIPINLGICIGFMVHKAYIGDYLFTALWAINCGISTVALRNMFKF